MTQLYQIHENIEIKLRNSWFEEESYVVPGNEVHGILLQNWMGKDLRKHFLLSSNGNLSGIKICLYNGKGIKGNCMTADETVSWLQFMVDKGCPKCKQKEDFRISVSIPIDKDRNFLSVNELLDMKDGSYIILCDKCDYYTRDIKTLM